MDEDASTAASTLLGRYSARAVLPSLNRDGVSRTLSRATFRSTGTLAIVCVCASAAPAATLTGTVVDPQLRIIPGAEVSLTCATLKVVERTDREGRFTFDIASALDDCTVRGEFPGCAPVERRVGFTAHYEFTRARNNTDGPFSFAARQNDIAFEWAPASGVST